MQMIFQIHEIYINYIISSEKNSTEFVKKLKNKILIHAIFIIKRDLLRILTNLIVYLKILDNSVQFSSFFFAFFCRSICNI